MATAQETLSNLASELHEYNLSISTLYHTIKVIRETLKVLDPAEPSPSWSTTRSLKIVIQYGHVVRALQEAVHRVKAFLWIADKIFTTPSADNMTVVTKKITRKALYSHLPFSKLFLTSNYPAYTLLVTMCLTHLGRYFDNMSRCRTNSSRVAHDMTESQPLIQSALKTNSRKRTAMRMAKQVAFVPTSKEVRGDLAIKDEDRSLDSISHVAFHHVHLSSGSKVREALGERELNDDRSSVSTFMSHQRTSACDVMDEQDHYRNNSQASRSHTRSDSNSAVCDAELTSMSFSGLSSIELQGSDVLSIDCDFDNLTISVDMSDSMPDFSSMLDKMVNESSVFNCDITIVQDSDSCGDDLLSDVATAGHKRRLISRRRQISISSTSSAMSTTAIYGSLRFLTPKVSRPGRLQSPPAILDRELAIKSSEVRHTQVHDNVAPIDTISSPPSEQGALATAQKYSCCAQRTCESELAPEDESATASGLSTSEIDLYESELCVGVLSAFEEKYLCKESKMAILLGACHGLTAEHPCNHTNTNLNYQKPESGGRPHREIEIPHDRPARFTSSLPTSLGPEGQLGQAHENPRFSQRRVAAQYKPSRPALPLAELPIRERRSGGLPLNDPARRKVQSHPMTGDEIEAIKAAHLPKFSREKSSSYHFPAAWQPAVERENIDKKQSHNNYLMSTKNEEKTKETTVVRRSATRKPAHKSWLPTLF
ncbi:hypothetical protein AUEXF2481DRAFT_92020 [Aureobasidium subglaciale EXF-2481]|uniref:Uncharacterized protein n=1 Tax=Aureobasidium subglaciale (strain EXF-2481) TaxID=1043005 RepID=A0A074YBL5_AURSE|nr:uncharacterized protein AUEXF2481DRAFT_92020 [Aureobasidium subglaciale EXF-2481]KEQ91552.1 hypothetical protein AUEXF2481DRAFT_92020 [Aureobasidium subglaciale EXF-2481]